MAAFVILEHSWNGVHWDFLLDEDNGADHLKTWAIDDRPKSGAESRALALPDHRRAYLHYEGAISGDRGFVKQWDRGSCEIHELTDHRVVLFAQGDRVQGLVEFERSGSLSSIGTGGNREGARSELGLWVVRFESVFFDEGVETPDSRILP